MNILTIVGAACLDPKFRKLLFKDPAAAARKYGFVLTQYEYAKLLDLVSHPNSVRVQQAMERVGGEGCPIWPCCEAFRLIYPKRRQPYAKERRW